MSKIRDSKEKIIKEIMNLRTMINNIDTRKNNSDLANDMNRKLNKIQDMVFNI